MRKRYALLLGLLVAAVSLHAQGVRFHGSLQNSIYSYESDETHTRIYQYAQFNLQSPCRHLELNGSLRALSDASGSLDSDQRFRAYALNLALKNLLNQRVDIVVGRQFLHPGTVLGGLDGARADIKLASRLSVQLYGGVESQYQRKAEVEERTTFGGVINWRSFLSTNWQAFYMQKDGLDDQVWQLAGLNLDNRTLPKTRMRVQVHYNTKASDLHRTLVQARTSWNKKLATVLEFRQQSPQVYAGSYFSMFELEKASQMRAGAVYALTGAWNLDGQYRHIAMEDGSADQIYLALANDNGSLGLIYESGDAGDQTGLMFDYSLELFPRFIESLYIDYSKYRTETVYEYDQQLANAVRCSYKLNSHWYVDLEYQWLKNRFKDNDSRILNHLSFRW